MKQTKVTKTKTARVIKSRLSASSRSVKKSANQTVGKAGKTKSPVTQAQSRSGLSVKVLDIKGRNVGTISLPKEIFGQKPNVKLLAQATRVYFANLKTHFAHTKTRAEVRGGGAKPWRQKGTGRARAGSIRSPLWVGGGITFGPRAIKVKLELPQKMKHKALLYALSQKAKGGDIKVIQNIEKIEPKTKKVANLLSKLEADKKTLLVISEKSQNVMLATRNIQNISVETPSNLNAYTVIKNNNLLISKESLAKFK